LNVLYYEPWQEKGEAILLWRHYLYYDFHKYYQKLNNHFHYFESDDCLYGLAFSDPKKADDFYDEVVRKAGKDCVKGKDKGNGLKALLGLGSSDKKSASSSTGQKKKLTVDDMSEPTAFQHLIHIGFNPLTGAFEPHNVPPEWAAFFEKAGLSKNDLEDKKTASYVAKFVQDNVIREDQLNATSTNTSNAMPKPPPAPSLPPVAQNEYQEQTLEKSTLPDVPNERANLMDSIRMAGLGSLKPVSKASPSDDPQPVAHAGSDLMASMLAKALAERNQKVAANGISLL
jgi:hypothetical protein